jgi:Uma2 family endonuclease
MNIQAKLPTTPDEFLRWNEGREGKREFVRGRVVEMMINVTRNHAAIASNFLYALITRIDRKIFTVGSADFGVRTPDGIRYPDIFVDRKTLASQGDDLAATEPVVLVEVLSPSSFGRDFVEKMSDYKGVDSLRHYLILSHEEPRVWMTSRQGAEWAAPIEIVGIDEVISLSALQIEVPVSEIYDSVDLRRPS